MRARAGHGNDKLATHFFSACSLVRPMPFAVLSSPFWRMRMMASSLFLHPRSFSSADLEAVCCGPGVQ